MRRPIAYLRACRALPFAAALLLTSCSYEPPTPAVVICTMPKDSLFPKTIAAMEGNGYRIVYDSFEEGEIVAERFFEGQKEQWIIKLRGPSLQIVTKVKGVTFQLMGGMAGVNASSNTVYNDSSGAGHSWYTSTMDSLRAMCARAEPPRRKVR